MSRRPAIHLIDWFFVAGPLVLVIAIGIYAQRQVKGVADFMSANRSAGRYLLSIAGGELQAGATVFVALFELFAHGGFAVLWWAALGLPVSYLVRVTGFVTYRYRETRAMTLGQFFEIRYNKSFRLFTGLLGFLAGILNFGIIPAIGSRVLVYFLGLPETVRIAAINVPTYVPLMALFLSITLFVAISGGVITVIVINTLEGIISQIFYLIIIVALLAMFTWPEMRAFLLDHPPGHSLVDPFSSFQTKDFNIWYILMGIALSVYGTMAWQNSGGYNSAGRTPHEGRMAAIIGSWREMGKNAVITLLALCALTYLHDPAFVAGASSIHHTVAQISDQQAREQMVLPIALAFLLPVGVKGIFCAILLMGIFGGDATHLHSWGSIFVQDFLVPLRRKPFGPRLHLLVLRGTIAGVALYAFLFGTFFHIADYIFMWWTVTTAIFVGGAGSAIIGGLYWKKGTTAGAWAAFITGALSSVGGIVVREIDASFHRDFFLNGTQIGFFASFMAAAVYIITSLLTHQKDFNLERMLHRAERAAIKPLVKENKPLTHAKLGWSRLIGLDDHFTTSDKCMACALFIWSIFWFSVFLIGTIWNLFAPWSVATWTRYYHVVGLGLPIFFAAITGIWFTWGGVRDLRSLFQRLGNERVNILDDGTVINHRNLDEAAAEELFQ